MWARAVAGLAVSSSQRSPALDGLLPLAVAAAILLLWLCWPWLSGMFPRASALLWPHLPVGLLLLGIASLLFASLVQVTSWFWSASPQNWEALTKALDKPWLPQVALLDWLWPWFPTLLAFFLLLFLAAMTLSRRLFHGVALTALASLILGVLLHDELPDPPYTVQESPLLQEVAGERVTRRVLQPLFHREDLEPDSLTATVMGVILLMGYGWLDRRNLQRTIQPIRVACIEDGLDADGKHRTRPDLEKLMREFLYKHAPHTPPPCQEAPWGTGRTSWSSNPSKTPTGSRERRRSSCASSALPRGWNSAAP